MSAPGDSGGPTFIDGEIAGITSYGVTLWGGDVSTSDIDGPFPTLNNSFGEFAGDTRVAYYADFINQTTAIPEPTTFAMFGIGILGIVGYIWRRQKFLSK
ncbi:PEP-CTERM sorting domain-containing protein [bacterium]|nr:PEP-CTERM sorting domain-containing protein [bacterium]